MKPLIRRVFNVIALLSLLLCIATPLLWARSYWITDFVNWYAPQSGGECLACAEVKRMALCWLGNFAQ